MGPARPIPEQVLDPGNAPQAGGSPAAADLVLQSRLQTAGKALLASAFILIIAGAALIEADPYAMAIGDVGFAGIGVGVGTFIASAFLLGLSRPVHVHDHPSERRHAIFVAPSRGLARGYVRSF